MIAAALRPPPILMVPIHVDALVVKSGTTVVGPSADFARLPYFDGYQDTNADVPYLSEELLALPFQNQNLYLPPGIHLHWALPDALTVGVQGAGSTSFPNVPNRWLVIRSIVGAMRFAERAWVVESDYLHPPGTGPESGCSTYPVDAGDDRQPPFRYLGRVVPLERWSEHDPSATYLDGISAVGYGEPMFAARYANCRNVFALHDPEIGAELAPGLQYDIVGWYSDSAQDHLALTLKRFRATYRDSTGQAATPGERELEDALKQLLSWGLDRKVSTGFPEQLRCYGRLRFDTAAKPASDDRSGPITVAVGDSEAQALTAYLSSPHGLGLQLHEAEQIDAILLATRLQHLQVDFDAKLAEARHEAGFNAVSGGLLWTIVPELNGHGEANGSETAPSSVLRLLDAGDIDVQLRWLNTCQQRYDAATAEIEALRGQLFADWYRYLLCLYPPQGSGEDYPDPDEVLAFIERIVIAPLDEKIAATGIPSLHPPGADLRSSPADLGAASLADALVAALEQLRRSLGQLNASAAAQAAHVTFRAQPIPAPRFWQPNDPVVLLAGANIRPSPRHGQDGRLHPENLLLCQVVDGAAVGEVTDATAMVKLIDSLEKPDTQEQIGFQVWSGPSWHPLELEWEVDLLPTAKEGNIDPARGQYAETFIVANYVLADNKPDLEHPASDTVQLSGAANLYSGTSVLTPFARTYHDERLAAFIYGVYAKQLGLPPLSDSDAALELRDQRKKTLDQIAQWLDTRSGEIIASQLDAEAKQRAIQELDLVRLALRAFIHLGSIQSLSQALGGFHEALLMRRQTLQLPIADPLGFADYQPFVQRVRERVQQSNHSAPQPLNDFNPVRSGALRLRALRLADSFGQVLDLKLESVVYAGALAGELASTQVPLPPRFIQPARLNFRWMSARDGQQETDAHPASSPICGWVVVNNLDSSLEIYDQNGQALGAIGPAGTWGALPGAPPVEVGHIGNAALQKMVIHLLGYTQDALLSFLDTLDTALINIEPASYAQHADLAVIMGRPLALVRASVDLELRDPPAPHQGWNQFRQDLRRDGRDHDAFTHVQIPIRIGDYGQLNDGLVGYWLEQDEALSSVFYAPNADNTDEAVGTHAGGELVIRQSLDMPAQYLSMLIDPRGKVHATCGVVPVKAIDIPPAHYVDALQRIAVTFRAGPVLSPPDALRLPLPTEAGYRWSWLEARGKSYREVTLEPRVEQAALGADLAAQIWERLLSPDVGWLALDPARSDAAYVVAAERRSAPRPAEFAPLHAEIEAALAQGQGPGTTITRARFVGLAAEAIGSTLWPLLLDPRVRWLDGITGQVSARVLVAGERASPALVDRFAGLESAVQAALDRRQHRIVLDAPGMPIGAGQEAREGWLALRVAEAGDRKE